ncbi:MAG: anthranilate synthase component I family protein [Acidobacteriota bacterium]|nr:anthranilate synthase component I family protein [Acidobacteriota bacterium]MDH3784069.1 anthranilate synthase component I family protein [Acidobacteriota bacterium]
MSSSLFPVPRPHYRRFRGSPCPLTLYRRVYGEERFGFLYESLEERGGRDRYSFLGGKPRVLFRSKGDVCDIEFDGITHHLRHDPLTLLRRLVQVGSTALPISTFPGGAVGYLGYDMIRFLAKIPDRNPDPLELPESQFIFPNEIIVIDHLDEVVHVLLYDDGGHVERAAELAAAIDSCPTPAPAASNDVADASDDVPLTANISREEFCAGVDRAKQYIRSGEIFQVVLSQRFEFDLPVPPIDLYAALRTTNPSPYMYYLHFDDLEIAGSSPEMLARLTGRRVVTRPLAGTRPRGRDAAQDEALAEELLADPKERAEHVMLVDLARNDLGRVCIPGSINIDEFFDVERYAKVMHIVSNVSGRIRDDRDAFDLFRSTFPAGTVSGAPKIRAMQIIDELETVRRGPYAGAIGYFSYLGDMDLCIGIRTIFAHRGKGYLQAGAGIVADSDPVTEYEETHSKARGLVRAIELARRRHH